MGPAVLATRASCCPGSPNVLHVVPIRLTPHPMPVDGLVVGQRLARYQLTRSTYSRTIRF
jgi:hypothetical protein